jgi:hypothetical protein
VPFVTSRADSPLTAVFARGGLVGGPLQRPYTHFLHNLLELVLILAALIDEIAEARPQSRRPIPTSS